MAVFTTIKSNELAAFFSLYSDNGLVYYSEISEGSENSNYLLKDRFGQFYIMTIYENRAGDDIKSLLALNNSITKTIVDINFPITTPLVFLDKKGGLYQKINGKYAALIQFVDGRPIAADQIQKTHVAQIGMGLSYMHYTSLLLKECGVKFTPNRFGLDSWRALFSEISPFLNSAIASELEKYLLYLEKNWPKDLQHGIIHGDLFPDNVFFRDNKLCGIIDNWFASEEILLYDLAIVAVSWCFGYRHRSFFFRHNYYHALTREYGASPKEKSVMPILMLGAALRFYLTRSYDRLVIEKYKVGKDPDEFLQKLRIIGSMISACDFIV